jgi:hypothetical protein
MKPRGSTTLDRRSEADLKLRLFPDRFGHLVQPTERPHDQENGNWDTQQPKQSCTSHFDLRVSDGAVTGEPRPSSQRNDGLGVRESRMLCVPLTGNEDRLTPMSTLLIPPALEVVLQGLHESEIRCGIQNEPPAGGITAWIDYGSRTEKATFYGTIVGGR